jgi:hypothetical protein
VKIDEDLLIEAVRTLNDAKSIAHADRVSDHLGPIGDDGRCFDVRVVADDLEELESRGKLKRATAADSGGESSPRERVGYELPA